MNNVVGSTQAANTFVENLLMRPVPMLALVAISLYLTVRGRRGSARPHWFRR
jgi:hypothetical protein